MPRSYRQLDLASAVGSSARSTRRHRLPSSGGFPHSLRPYAFCQFSLQATCFLNLISL
jgi:hypothetical protein